MLGVAETVKLKAAWTAVTLLVVALVIVVFGLAAVRIFRGDPTPQAEPPRVPHSALFVGDSYSAGGYPGVTKDQAFPCPTAQQLGWACYRDAVGATGYQSDGKAFWPLADTYEKRLPQTRLTYPDPDVIVVSGGRNDDQLQIGVTSRNYLLALKKAYPRARIFVLEPFWMGPVPALVAEGRLAVEASAKTAGVTWVPTADWLAPTDLSGDWVHPTLVGQQAITQHLVAYLRRATST